MTTLLAGLAALVCLAWGWDVFVVAAAAGGSLPWTVRQQGLYLSGLLAVAMMSLAMFLAARPGWVEGPLGGLDRMVRTHKWAGMLATGFAALHWLLEMSSDILKAVVGRAGRVPQEKFTGLLEVLRDLAEDLGEWAIYAVLALLALTLWKRFPYLCALLPGIRLHVHDARQGGRLDAEVMAGGKDRAGRAEVWFCGPQGLARNLKAGLRATWRGKLRFHQEAFEFR